MSIKEFDQSTTFSNPDLPSGALSSKQFNTIVELLSEGEIEGSATASKNGITDKTSDAYINSFKKDIFLNGTPILQAAASVTAPTDSEFNFQDVGFEFREGTANQTFISGIKNIETEVGIGTTVTTSNPVTHTINQSTINAVRVTLQFPSMQVFNDQGGIDGTKVNLLIKVIENDGTTTTAVDDTVEGRSTNAYFRDYLINFKTGTSFPVQIRVERVTADSTDNKTVNAFRFNSATNIIMKQNTYPNTAHVGLRFSAEKFPRIPNRVYKIRGVKIKIPNVATVNSTHGNLTYSGTWDGTFKTNKEWCSDPAWILYDLLTNDRYGCNLAESSIDKFTFKTVSEYCGELIDAGNGDGSTEPRFSCNVNITQQQEAFNLINDLCGVMRAIAFYSAGGVSISQDAPKSVKYIFNNSNVTESGFVYNGSSLKTRHTIINVQYLDMVTQELDIETVEADSTTQTKYGIKVKTIKAFACTSRGQAARLGRWFLFNEQNSGETCSFETTAAAGVLVRCGDIIEISDSLKSGVRRGGLLESVTSTTVVVLDDSDSTDIPTISNSPTLSVVLPDGTLETKTISNINGKTITVSSAFSAQPNVNAPYIIETSTLETTQWRVISVKETQNLTYTITALEHIEGKYAFVEDGSALPERNITTLTQVLDPPEGLEATEQIVLINSKAVSKILVDWQTQSGAARYELLYKVNDGSFTKIETVQSYAEITNSEAGTYEFRLFSFNGVGEPSRNPAIKIFEAVGKTAPPSDITNLSYEPISDEEIRLRWDAVPDIDVRAGGRIHIRHSPKTDGSGTFQDATDLVFALSGASTEKNVPLLEGEYILKAQDDGDRFSTGETSLVIDLPESQPKLLIQSRRENLDTPPFQGAKTSVGLDPTAVPPFISLEGSGNIDDVGVTIAGTFDDIDSLDDLGGVATTGTYLFNETLDLGGIFTLNLRKHVQSNSVYSTDLFDSIQNLDLRQNFDGTGSVDTNAEVFVQFSQDGTNYNSFQKFANGRFKGRTFKFKCVLNTNDVNQDIRVTELGYDATFTRRTESGTRTSSGNTTVNFDNNFFTGTSALLGVDSNLPAIGITAFDMASGDFFEITNRTSSGFQIHFKNSSNASVSRNFNFTATGFGKAG